MEKEKIFKFQFHKVRLKGPVLLYLSPALVFQFHKVRLKAFKLI